MTLQVEKQSGIIDPSYISFKNHGNLKITDSDKDGENSKFSKVIVYNYGKVETPKTNRIVNQTIIEKPDPIYAFSAGALCGYSFAFLAPISSGNMSFIGMIMVGSTVYATKRLADWIWSHSAGKNNFIF